MIERCQRIMRHIGDVQPLTDPSRAIVVGASADEFAHLTQCLSGWELVNVPLDKKQTRISCALPAAQVRQMPDDATLAIAAGDQPL